MPAERPKVKVCANVPEDLRDQWVYVFGEYGSFSWLIETSMREMLATVAHYPTKEAVIRSAIRKFVSDLAIEAQQRKPSDPNLPTNGNPSPANSGA